MTSVSHSNQAIASQTTPEQRVTSQRSSVTSMFRACLPCCAPKARQANPSTGSSMKNPASRAHLSSSLRPQAGSSTLEHTGSNRLGQTGSSSLRQTASNRIKELQTGSYFARSQDSSSFSQEILQRESVLNLQGDEELNPGVELPESASNSKALPNRSGTNPGGASTAPKDSAKASSYTTWPGSSISFEMNQPSNSN